VLPGIGSLGICNGHPGAPGDALTAKVRRAVAAAVRFLAAHQHPDGGWGETPDADRDCSQAGVGGSTPLHTATALSALLSVGCRPDTDTVQKGVNHLLATMTPDGRWEDEQAAFTFIAGRFYYRYELLNYFLPLEALTRFGQSAERCSREDHARR
jgi:squalene-hopene/tetraprenyl-beta-curcumene cyclase